MLKKSLLSRVALCAAALTAGSVVAQNGAPHSLTATGNLSQVSLGWCAPAAPIELKWHDGSDYNGMSGRADDPEGYATFYAAAKFTPADLQAVAGQTVDSISYFEYRHAYKVWVQVYENEKLVSETPVDVSKFTKNTWKTTALSKPYTIAGDKDVMFVVKYQHGTNQDFVANTDRYPTTGKGDVYSYDGKTWHTGGVGDFMITAIVRNNATATPEGYNVYRDGSKVNSSLLTRTDTVLDNEPDGTHRYMVGAVYAQQGELKSAAVEATAISASKLLAPAASFKGSAQELNGTLAWQKPLAGGETLTWSGSEMGNHIGGTSTTSPKVWVKQEFSSSDLLAFQNYQINSIAAYVAEATLSSVKLYVIKNGTIDYSQDVPDSVVQKTTAGAWNQWQLTTPYVMTPGNDYAYGVYYTHTKSTHPVGVDNQPAIDGKGNSFSISAPRSSSFNATKPTWKTLSSGNIAGNFMLRAQVSPVGEATASEQAASYDLYRNGTPLFTGKNVTEWADSVPEPGTYNYTLKTNYASGKQSPLMTVSLNYTLPAAYEAPLIVGSNFDPATKAVSLEWSNSAVNLQHYGTPSYMMGFDEAMTLLYGSKFSASELKSLKGYELRSLKFIIGQALDTLRLEVRTGDNQVLYSEKLDGTALTPQAIYTLKLDKPIAIPEGKDLYIVYNTTLPAGNKAIVIDKGPAADGGAMVSVTGGASWMKLGTIASDYKDYNIVIGATALPASSKDNAGRQAITLGTPVDGIKATTLDAAQLRQGLGIEAVKPGTQAPARRRAAAPVVKSYRVYRNNTVIAEQEGTTWGETLEKCGTFNYHVTAVYQNGWESPQSKTVTVVNTIAQKLQAPYHLQGNATATGQLQLNWEAAGKAAEFNYQKSNTDIAVGMTSSGSKLKSYCAIKMAADTLAHYAGLKITHIKFKLDSLAVENPAVFVMAGDNIIYRQELDAESLVKGWNVVRLNNPVAVDNSQDMSVGYYLEYATGVKPSTCDAGTPAVPGYSDLISSSASAGYWYSLKTKFKLNYGWRISAVLATPDTAVQGSRSAAPRKAATAITYNVYCNGEKIASGLDQPSYTVASPMAGRYVVTAETGGEESAESNAVVYTVSSGVDTPAASKTVSSIAYYNVAGQQVATPVKGVNIVVTRYTDGTQATTKVVK